MRLTRHHLLQLTTAALAVVAMSHDAGAADASSLGVWKKRVFTFSQAGFTTTYSCSGLRNKLKVLLRASGARDDVEAVPIGCGDPGAPSAFAQARLTFHVLVPAPAGETTGTWRSVALAPRSPHELTSGDCELVERFRSKVLPLLTTRNVVDRVRCVPNQASASVDLRFQVFTHATERP